MFQVQNMLQQLQDKFQTTSDQVLTRNILWDEYDCVVELSLHNNKACKQR